jgi:hypothetical protein
MPAILRRNAGGDWTLIKQERRVQQGAGQQQRRRYRSAAAPVPVWLRGDHVERRVGQLPVAEGWVLDSAELR